VHFVGLEKENRETITLPNYSIRETTLYTWISSTLIWSHAKPWSKNVS